MREILFRGKRMDNKEWVEGIFETHPITKLTFIRTPNHICFDVNMVIPETVGQFTGLTDKNGKKIFEGDILKNEYDDVEVVEYFHNRFVPFAPPFAFDSWHENEIEIIGNVTDNPELLKGGDENA